MAIDNKVYFLFFSKRMNINIFHNIRNMNIILIK
jgi:hypothetical protein